MKEFNEIIKKIGEELGIKVTLLSDGWTTILEKDNKTKYLSGYQFDLIGHALGKIIDEKDLFYDLLKYLNIPIIEHHVIFREYDKEDVLDYFQKHNNEIIVKGCIGHSGNSVYKVNNESDLFNIIDKEFVKQYSIALCPYYQIRNEYRVIVLDNEVKLIFGKIKPKILGDGKRSVSELAKEYCSYYINHENVIENLNYIPKENEEVEINYKFNLSSGGKTFLDIDPDLKTKVMDLAVRVTKEVGIRFASVDIINTMDNKILVMEANSGVKMRNFILQNQEGYDLAYNIYKDALKKMFNI